MNTIQITAAFIAAAHTENTGGGCMADFLLLKNGKAIVLTDECVCIFDNPNDFLNADGEGEVENGREMCGTSGCARFDSPTDRSPMGLTFVERIGTYEPDGPVSVDLIVLCDGRVLGVDTESIVLYPSMEAFDKEVGDPTTDWPSLALEAAVA